MFFLSDLFFGKKTRNSLEEHGVDPIFRQPTWDKRDMGQTGDRYNQRSMEVSAFLFWTLVNICARSKSWIIVGLHTYIGGWSSICMHQSIFIGI